MLLPSALDRYGSPYGIRTRDFRLERAASWAARRTGHAAFSTPPPVYHGESRRSTADFQPERVKLSEQGGFSIFGQEGTGEGAPREVKNLRLCESEGSSSAFVFERQPRAEEGWIIRAQRDIHATSQKRAQRVRGRGGNRPGADIARETHLQGRP